jgi:hypothetical protein
MAAEEHTPDRHLSLTTPQRVGGASLLLGLAWLVGLGLVRYDDVADWIAAGGASPAATARLGERGLADPGAVYAAVLTLLLEVTLALILAAAGGAFLLRAPYARRAALFACAGAVAVTAVDTLLRAFALAAPGRPVDVAPLALNGVVTLGALALWGGLSLPGVGTASAGEAARAGTAAGG